jgi:hypothetical protein
LPWRAFRRIARRPACWRSTFAPRQIFLATYERLTAKAETAGVTLEGVYLQQMIPGGMEIIVSAFRDPIFGSMISCGAGGNLTEVIDDIALARGPLDIEGAKRLLQRLRIVKASGKLNADADIVDLARFVAHFSQVAHNAPWEKFVIEINPVKWSAKYVGAVDGLLIIEKP